MIRFFYLGRSQQGGFTSVFASEPIEAPEQAITAPHQLFLIQNDHNRARNQHKKKHWMTPIIQCLIKRRSGFTLPGLIVNPLTLGKSIIETEFSTELAEKAFEIRKNAVAHSNQP